MAMPQNRLRVHHVVVKMWELKEKYSSSSLGAEPPLIGGFGLLNDILPLCSIMDTG